MAMPRYPNLHDLLPSPEELDATKTAASAGQSGATWGSGVGTAVGGGLGALGFLVPGAGVALGPALMTLGAGVGGALGGAAGGVVGNSLADQAAQRAQKLAEVRQRIISQSQLRQQALAALEAL